MTDRLLDVIEFDIVPLTRAGVLKGNKYFFTYENSRDAFAIPHDLEILAEVFDGGYHCQNAFWRATSLKETADPARVRRIHAIYDELSAVYQKSKAGNSIPLN